MLDPQDGLDDNQKYVYSVTAINSIGNTTSHEKHFGLFTLIIVLYDRYCAHYSVTSDMLSITTEREENTLFIWCHFISGSDALGCKVAIVNYIVQG